MLYTRLMVAAILSLVFILTNTYALERTDIFVLHLGYNGTDIWSSGFEISKGFPYSDPSPPDESFRADIVAANGSVLYSTNFSISLLVFTHPLTILNSTEHILRMPFYKNADRITIYANGDLVLTVEIRGFLDEEGEGVIKVEPKDSLLKEKKPYKKERKRGSSIYMPLGFILLVTIIALLYIVFIKKRG